MSNADLIQRLRARVEKIYGGHGNIIESPDDDCIAAAAAIERLTRERDDARANVDGMRVAGEKMAERALAAEAREAKLREALAVYANPEAWRLAGNNVPALNDAGKLARTALTAKAEKGS